MSRPSFVPFWGHVKVEKHVPLPLVIDIIIEQGTNCNFSYPISFKTLLLFFWFNLIQNFCIDRPSIDKEVVLDEQWNEVMLDKNQSTMPQSQNRGLNFQMNFMLLLKVGVFH